MLAQVHGCTENALKVKSEHIRVSKGDVTNINDLGIAMEECDVIISALNISRKSDFPWSKLRTPETLMSDVMKILVNIAGENNIQKIVTVKKGGLTAIWNTVFFFKN